MKTKLLIPIFLFLLIFSAASFAQTVQNIPTLQKYVNDFVGVLSSSEKNSINNLAGEIEANTTVQVAVLIVNSTQPYDIQTYSNQVFRANGVGQKENNNGILIVVAIADRSYWIEVGYGLEGLIPDAKAGDIGRYCFVDNFRSGLYGDGIYCAVQDIGNIVQGQPEVIAQINPNDIIAPLAFVLIPFLFIIAAALSIEYYQKCPRDGTRMKRTIAKNEIVYVCPKCGYKKKKKRRNFVWLLFFGPRGGWSGGGGGGGFGGGSSGGGGAGGKW